MGYGGEIKLELITEGNKMVDIKIISDAETSPVMTRAFSAVYKRKDFRSQKSYSRLIL